MRVTDFVFLLVEDDPDQILLIQRAFSEAKLVNPLRVVRDGAEAIDYLAGAGAFADRSRHPLPSLILLDLRLPKKSGFEVLEWLRADAALKGTPVVVLTSSAEPQDMSRAHSLGVSSYLVKPVRFPDLLELVKGVGMYWMILNRGEDRTASPADRG